MPLNGLMTGCTRVLIVDDEQALREVIEDVLAATSSDTLGSIEKVLEADVEARRIARNRVAASKGVNRPRATSFA